MSRTLFRIAVTIICVTVVYSTLQAAMKVTTQVDKTFDFSKVSTWQWSTAEKGQVIVARTADDDPAAIRARAEPIIVDAITSALAGRGIQSASGAAADVRATYYLLITLSSDAQTMGQFLPSTGEWGLPPITGATQSLRTVQQGSVVLDFSANDRLVWRGVAKAEIKPGQSAQKSEALIREAVREIVKRISRKS
jgi:hypothetical protein